ncbi:hypothetical protein [Kitasatospora sp. NPDC089509]|uniref:hypothetical protein n=1 Tax=Kitasatospora sp. NPDC089509 TaxID=3364079 RepID=UPI003804CD7B
MERIRVGRCKALFRQADHLYRRADLRLEGVRGLLAQPERRRARLLPLAREQWLLAVADDPDVALVALADAVTDGLDLATDEFVDRAVARWLDQGWPYRLREETSERLQETWASWRERDEPDAGFLPVLQRWDPGWLYRSAPAPEEALEGTQDEAPEDRPSVRSADRLTTGLPFPVDDARRDCASRLAVAKGLDYPLCGASSVASVCWVAAHDARSARLSAVGVPVGAV